MADHNIAHTFCALGDAIRLRMVESLVKRSLSTSQLSDNSNMTIAGALKHLKVLERAGIVCKRKDGRTVTYSLSKGAFESIVKWTDKQRRFWDQSLNRLHRVINASKR